MELILSASRDFWGMRISLQPESILKSVTRAYEKSIIVPDQFRYKRVDSAAYRRGNIEYWLKEVLVILYVSKEAEVIL